VYNLPPSVQAQIEETSAVAVLERAGRIVSIPGTDVFLAFTPKSMQALQARVGDRWLIDAPAKLDILDTTFISACVETGGRIRGAGFEFPFAPGPRVRFSTLGALGVAPGQLAPLILDALMLAAYGVTYGEHLSTLAPKPAPDTADQPAENAAA